jgi:hypothetical protein
MKESNLRANKHPTLGSSRIPNTIANGNTSSSSSTQKPFTCLPKLTDAKRTYYVHILAVSNVADLMQAMAVVSLSALASQLVQVTELSQSMLTQQVNQLSRAPEFLKPKL